MLRTGAVSARRSDALPYAVFDVETDGLRGELLYATVSCEHGYTAQIEGTPDDIAKRLWRLILTHSGHGHAWREHIWWAHNGGNYDFLYLLAPAREDVSTRGANITPITRSDAIIGWRIKHAKHRTDLRDSYALLPASLDELTKQLAPDLPKLTKPFDADGRGFDPQNPDHRAYAQRDADGLVAVLVRYRAMLHDLFGVAPGWSAAATALRAWRNTHDGSYSTPPPQAAMLARHAYFGGMVRLSTTRPTLDMATIDINSMYPYVMRQFGVPDGTCVQVTRFVNNRPGIYRVRVTVPDSEAFTFLPHRDAHSVLSWPTGTFETSITSDELLEAKRASYRIEIVDGWVWERIVYPFGEFVDKIEQLRANGGAVAFVGKITGNSLYGKFGAKPTHDDWRLSADCPGPGWTMPAFDMSDPDNATRYAGLWVYKDRPLHADYLAPHWAAWITAHARLYLRQLAWAVGPGAVSYADTDSLTIPARLLDTLPAGTLGTRFGQAKVERRWSVFVPLAPKVYWGVPAGTPGAVYKAKGIPHRLAFSAFTAGPGAAVGWDSPNGSLQVLTGAPMLTPRTRKLSALAGSLAWRAGPNGTVLPAHRVDNAA